MLINTFLDTEDFVHLYYPEDEPAAVQGCGAGARMASKYPRQPSPTPDYTEVAVPSTSESMTERERYRAPPQPEPPPHKVRAADLYPRLRTHYDEPGLDAGFTPICGEFVQWVGRTADGGTIAMSNYRLHAHPRRRTAPGASVPLRLIDALEISELLHLIVLCKNGRQLKLSFTTSEQCAEWFRRLNTALAPMGSVQETFAAAYAAWAKELPLTSVHRQLLAESQGQQKPWFGRELERLEFTMKGAWRVTAVNADYKLCASYPPLLVVPASIGDEDLDSVARFRALRRIPTAVWRHRGNGAVIARSSQPEVGWFGWRSSEDEKLLAAFVTACQEDRGNSGSSKTPVKLLIVDARSYASAVTNRARGGGCECQQYYPAADIQFMSLPNIHHVRRSFQQLRALCAEPPDQPNWHSSVERSLWLQYVSGVCRAAVAVGRAVCAGRPVLVHCSDGWDRTPQIVAAAQLLLDPYYRTIEGFRVLIEREWLDFGHKFADRCGHQFGPEEPNERSPIFLQWLDVVYQVMRQFPCTFEFNEAYLIKLATHVHSCMFGTFLCNNGRERAEARLQEHTAQLWRLLADSPAYRNHVYSPQSSDQVIYPECGSRYMRVWWGLFSPAAAPQPDGPPTHTAPTSNYTPATANGVMTKTRSCDNLAVEGERRTAQRRCSDPNIAPDLMKLSSVVGECRSALTDSCVDQLPALPALPVNNHYDQVDGPTNHLECSTSGRSSSSVERELERAAAADNSTDTLTTDGVVPVSIDVVDLASQPSVVIPAPPAVQRVRGPSVHSAAGSPDDALFLTDTYNVIGIAEAAREASRARNMSITWRSLSESSNQSSNGFDIETPHQRPEQPLGLESLPLPHESSPIELESSIIHDSSPIGLDTTPLESSLIGLETLKIAHENSPLEVESSIALESLPMRLESSLERDSSPEDLENHNATNGDVINHNILALTNGRSINVNGVNGLDEIDTNGCGTSVGTSSSLSSESDAECAPPRGARGARGARGSRRPSGSQLTLCPPPPPPPPPPPAPASPTHHHDGHTKCPDTATSNRRTSATSGIETSGESVSSTCGARCGCGASGDACVSSGGGTQPHRAAPTAHGGGSGWPTLPTIDPIDGLPPHIDPLQARLHQIIVSQKMVVEELSRQLREARCALSRASGSPHGAPARPPRTSPSAPEPSQLIGSSRSGSSGGSVSSASGSGSGSEVEVGEEARGVVWVPDRAAPRCQHCHHHFWLARRRHHCRRCGGIFCGSCSEVSAWGSCAVRMCRRCRAQR